MVTVRVLTKEGIQEFRNYVHNLRSGLQVYRPNLNIEPYSYEFKPSVQVDEDRLFSTRMDLAKYLSARFAQSSIRRVDVIGNNALWTWFAYLWFDQLCPIINGKRRIREDSKYICSSDYRDYYRHYVAAAYDMFSLHGEQNSKLFLQCPVYIHNDFTEQLASRQYIISNKTIVELAHLLYWDSKENKPKRGGSDRNKPGNVRRLIKVLSQLELTYDIHSMDARELLKLLPKEFDIWKK
ncbi:MAG: hypothetical protein ACP5KW_08600 [Thermoproteota archaeon]|jgi:hypothetical protein